MKVPEKKEKEDSTEEPIDKLTSNISTIKFLSIIQCIFIIIIGLYFIEKFYRDNTSLTTQLTVDNELLIHPKGERIIDMVKSSGIPEGKWMSFGNGLKSACKGSVNWSVVHKKHLQTNLSVDWSVNKTTSGTIFVEAKCNDLNDKHKKFVIAEKTNGKYDFQEYITKLRAQFLIYVDGKNFKVGYTEIKFGFASASQKRNIPKSKSLGNREFIKIIMGEI